MKGNPRAGKAAGRVPAHAAPARETSASLAASGAHAAQPPASRAASGAHAAQPPASRAASGEHVVSVSAVRQVSRGASLRASAPAIPAATPAAQAAPAASAPRAASHRSPLRRVLHAAGLVLTALAVLLAAALVGVRLVGLEPYAVLSGSMEPAYHVGSVVYVRDVDPADLGPGDVITFMLDEDTVATHRVVEVVPDGEDPSVLRFRTKGDANDAADGGLVHCSNVIGTPVFTVPYLGYVAGYVQGPPGCWAALAACALLVMLAFLPDLFAKEGEGEEAAAPPREGGRGAADAASAGSRAVPRRAQAAPACAKAASPGRSASHARPGGMHGR